MVTRDEITDLQEELAKIRGWSMSIAKEARDLETKVSDLFRDVVKW